MSMGTCTGKQASLQSIHPSYNYSIITVAVAKYTSIVQRNDIKFRVCWVVDIPSYTLSQTEDTFTKLVEIPTLHLVTTSQDIITLLKHVFHYHCLVWQCPIMARDKFIHTYTHKRCTCISTHVPTRLHISVRFMTHVCHTHIGLKLSLTCTIRHRF